MIANGSLEPDAGIEQRFVREFEFLDEVRRPLTSVEVVAEHQHEVVGELAVRVGHLLADLVLLASAGPVVADHGELDRVGPVRERRNDAGSGRRRPQHPTGEQRNRDFGM